MDKDENNNKITIKKISSKYIKKEDEIEIDFSKNTNNDQCQRNETSFSKNTTQKNNANNKNKNLLYSKTRKINNDEDLRENELIDNELNKRNININNIYPNKRIKSTKKIYNLNNGNSETERIIKKPQNNDASINRKSTEYNIRDDIKKYTGQSKEILDNITKNFDNNSQGSLANKNLIFIEKYYYHNSFKDYEDVKNGIFCISGKLFTYMYKNKDRKGAKKFMDDMVERCKIFFDMSSVDKSCLIEYYNNDQNNIVCTIGQCENDIDSIISSNVGVNLKNPNNKNTILCHFYSSKNDIICLKDIIEIGRLYFENINILEYISFTYSITINFFILCCVFRDYKIVKNELDFLEIELFVLLIASFLGNINKENIYINQKSKILTIYYAIICAEIIIVKACALYLFETLFTGDRIFDYETLNQEYISFCFVLCNEYILNTITAFNLGSFYKQSPFENRILICLVLLYIAYIAALSLLCSSNFSIDILDITFFAHNEKLFDSFTDKNKEYLVLAIITDIIGTFLICGITKIFFKICIK